MSSTPPSSPRVTGRTRDAVIAADRAIYWFSRHWLLCFNIFIFIYIGLPFLAPILMHFGATDAANVIYTIYSPLCHQLGFRSWFLFGEQAAYPRDVFQSFTGINPDDLWAARGFIGTAELGFKTALCQRDVGIYLAILFFGITFGVPVVRAKLKPLPWWAWILIGIVPIGLDGFSQLFSQYPWNTLPFFSILPMRESTPFLRTFTGALFGLANVWLAYPHVEESMRETTLELERKFARIVAAAQAE